MKSLLLAGIMSAAFMTAGYADQYWVSGDRSSGKCNISTSQPVTYGLPAYDNSGSEYKTAWTSGPYQSMDAAKLARSGISACPSEPEPAADEKKD